MVARALPDLRIFGHVVADDRRVLVEGVLRVDQRWQGLVLNLDLLDAVGHRVAVGADHEGDLLVLEVHLLVG